LRSLLALASLLSGWDLSHAADRAAEHVTLTNGFDLICDHHEQNGDRIRLYTEPASSNFIEIPASQVVSFEVATVAGPAASPPAAAENKPLAGHADLTKTELHELLSAAGASHNLDVNLLASVVRAESGGHTQAVSKAGARGLMQLMPKTAADLGVNDSFRPDENIAAGTAYLDALLTRYHDNLALALAAYNAGPAAVDRWHGVPPYRETRLYVARIIRDFNASVKAARLAQQAQRAVAKADAPQSSPQGAQIR
jgi:soluble lytic murein transglycosylase-like protein